MRVSLERWGVGGWKAGEVGDGEWGWREREREGERVQRDEVVARGEPSSIITIKQPTPPFRKTVECSQRSRHSL